MSILNKFLECWNAYRTAPLGSSWVIAGSALVASFSYCAIGDIEFIVPAGASVSVILCAYDLAKDQFSKRERLEAAIARRGFDQRLLKHLMREWCDRQTVLAVCVQQGEVDAFYNVYSKAENIGLPWLPNF